MDVSDILSEMKKAKVLDIHKNAITKPSNEKGRWQTYIISRTDGEQKKRKNLKPLYLMV